ncbi:hypothetical protein [Microbacterium sp. NPDC076895]|uniref:hypothetical protein n=1 Tax=Microbacterium sp. NPDC076895 TaxID=3154957 RepID=UPI00342F8C58
MNPNDLRRGLTFSHHRDSFVVRRVLGGTVIAQDQRTHCTRHLAIDVVLRAVEEGTHGSASAGKTTGHDLRRVCARMGIPEIAATSGAGSKSAVESMFRVIDDMLSDLPGRRRVA